MAYHTEALVVSAVGNEPRLSPVILDTLRDDELLVEMHATGICHTDVACMEGKLPTGFPCVLGHEGAGVVLRTGKGVKDVSEGDKVILSYNFCTGCQQCLCGQPAYCDNLVAQNFGGKRPDGSRTIRLPNSEQEVFANFFGQSSFCRVALVNRASVARVAADTPLDIFAPLGCGVQTGAGAVLNTLNVQEGTSVAVFGVGAVGQSAIMAARLRGASIIIAVDLEDSRLEMARELGATHTLLGSTNVSQQISAICAPSNGVEFAVDCSGVTQVIETMLDSLATRGRAASVGSPAPGKRAGVDVFAHLTLGREYVGCHQGSSVAEQMIPYLIDQHKQGKFPVEKLITYYPVEHYQQAFRDLKHGRAIKAVLRWKEGSSKYPDSN
ncbi:alcohol dehydrogenase [Aspergillus bombycis]|uniref:Alcohol dehydrogenase n=1 Tax=Aspergillus bombycis TaxID=109264 RepID=A0A1F8ADQ0_9EURO|nr:alcohol dehydrogenase [Aspergillus bombycis]OGM49495.1 alcohol dehydrogenase [Aspergillus bombycis]